jgi:3-hydroxyacyl-[acyl-carrier-protein] dehydratase
MPLDREDIKKILPHREPFLFVDRILELSDTQAVGVKEVRADEPYFKGHFPGKPVMPGVLMIEALAQVGGIIMLSRAEYHGKIAYFASIQKARFRKIVQPGDDLYLEVQILKTKTRIGMAKGVGKVNGVEVCDAEFMFSLGE